MGEAELRVLDRFEEVTKRPELMLEFTLQPGEIYFINNYKILRLWTVRALVSRETPPDFASRRQASPTRSQESVCGDSSCLLR
jgi:hypothetical protein